MASAKAPEPDFLGSYRLQGGPDVASALILRADGTYAYWLMAGALDEASQGQWFQADGKLVLTTQPTPVAPEFRQGEFTAGESEGLSLLVSWPGGEGIAGIDFRIGLSDGETVEGYTQRDGWETALQGKSRAEWIELYEPIHRVASPRFAIPERITSLHFVLMPNDMGQVDLSGATVELAGDRLTLHRSEGSMNFIRSGSD